ncbi:hypothetical protein SDC9_139749 [bioreactor metagenome]|uniref:Uncharacterized protein n=1 Tax=bioreactor metagenome TaxID=1076179 RepID=A0A645DSZ0_9ZZZZ
MIPMAPPKKGIAKRNTADSFAFIDTAITVALTSIIGDLTSILITIMNAV